MCRQGHEEDYWRALECVQQRRIVVLACLVRGKTLFAKRLLNRLSYVYRAKPASGAHCKYVTASSLRKTKVMLPEVGTRRRNVASSESLLERNLERSKNLKKGIGHIGYVFRAQLVRAATFFPKMLQLRGTRCALQVPPQDVSLPARGFT